MVDGLILELGTDSTILSSTVTLEMEFGLGVVHGSDLIGKNERLADIKSGGILIINSHGNATSVNGMSVDALAQMLSDSGLRGPVEIVLLACNTGTFGAPYALELKVALVQRYKIMCSVSAPRGRVGANLLGQWKVNNAGGSHDLTDKGAMFSSTQSF